MPASHNLTRREFIRHSAVAVAATGVPGWGKADQPAAQTSTPPGRPRMFPGCCAYSYGKYLAHGQMTMEDFFLKAVDLGLYGVDVTTYWLKSTDPAYLAGLRHLAFRHGLQFSGTGIATNFSHPDAAQHLIEIEKLHRWVDATDELGASHIRVFAGDHLPSGVTREQATPWVVESLKRACDYSGSKGITLGIENHGTFTTSAPGEFTLPGDQP